MRIIADVVGLESMRAQLKELIDEGKVEITVLEEHGPGGGWPVVAFDVYDSDSARKVIKLYWDLPDPYLGSPQGMPVISTT